MAMTYLPQQHTHTFSLAQKILELLKDEDYYLAHDVLSIATTLMSQRDPNELSFFNAERKRLFPASHEDREVAAEEPRT